MIRILIVDDFEDQPFFNQLKREIGTSFNTEVELVHLNPTPHFKGQNPHEETASMLEVIQKHALDFWDIFIVDMNLNEVNLPDKDKLHLSLSIADTFRQTNRSAITVFYSGTLEEHVRSLLTDNSPEAALKRIYNADISNFVPRRILRDEMHSTLGRPPWLLQLDRLLMRYSGVPVRSDSSEFRGMTFDGLAKALRQQNPLGIKLANRAAEFGIACLADLNK